MESTGVYWISIFEMLEAAGIRVYLVNARHFKIVPGRNSDHGTLLLNVQTGTARDRDWDIYRLPTDSGTAVPVLNADWREENPRVSPDGRWLAYQSNERRLGSHPHPALARPVASNHASRRAQRR